LFIDPETKQISSQLADLSHFAKAVRISQNGRWQNVKNQPTEKKFVWSRL
jgi:hypothetical protein